jgi:Cu(I)/Ag(I) efflux system periplasmic protein CusF
MKPKFLVAFAIAMACPAGVIALAAPGAQVLARQVLAQAEKPSGVGVLNAIDTGKRTLNITHEAIAALRWPGMTMDFRVAPGVDIAALKPGAQIVFTLGRGADGLYAIEEIRTR